MPPTLPPSASSPAPRTDEHSVEPAGVAHPVETCTLESEGQLTTFPIRRENLWNMYKIHQALNWTAEEIDFSQDYDHFKKLTKGEQHFVKMVLAFFATSDGIVNLNLLERFLNEVQWIEAKYFYAFQAAMENVHGETYGLSMEVCVPDPEERGKLLNAIEEIECVSRKAKWAYKWIGGNQSFAQRLVGMVCVEGIFFSGSFCAIYWLKKRGLMPGLTFSNELISRDEGLHTEFACMLYEMLDHKLTEETIHAIVRDAVDVEKEFICDALPVSLVGMNSQLMSQYIEFVADRLCVALGASKLYGSTNPFDFMDMICMKGRANYFEKKVSTYGKARVRTDASAQGTISSHAFSTDDDF